MTDALAIHAASPDEVAAAHRNVFDIWGKGLPLAEHVRFRLDSPKHRLATWYVGCIDGRVVVSLGAYPLRFRIRFAEVPGIAIGSVYTLADYRRRGFAGQLLAWVEDQTRQNGAAISLLYSDIDPSYYAQRGYVTCPSFEGWRDPNANWPGDASAHRLIEFDAASHLSALMKLYRGYHGAMPLAIARDEPYWHALLKRSADERFFALLDRNGEWSGYVRLGGQIAAWRITDFALAEQSDELAGRLYAAILVLARKQGAERVGGWLPHSHAAEQFFSLTPRRTEITMVKSLCVEHSLGDELIAASDRFCEIDHV